MKSPRRNSANYRYQPHSEIHLMPSTEKKDVTFPSAEQYSEIGGRESTVDGKKGRMSPLRLIRSTSSMLSARSRQRAQEKKRKKATMPAAKNRIPPQSSPVIHVRKPTGTTPERRTYTTFFNEGNDEVEALQWNDFIGAVNDDVAATLQPPQQPDIQPSQQPDIQPTLLIVDAKEEVEELSGKVPPPQANLKSGISVRRAKEEEIPVDIPTQQTDSPKPDPIKVFDVVKADDDATITPIVSQSETPSASPRVDPGASLNKETGIESETASHDSKTKRFRFFLKSNRSDEKPTRKERMTEAKERRRMLQAKKMREKEQKRILKKIKSDKANSKSDYMLLAPCAPNQVPGLGDVPEQAESLVTHVSCEEYEEQPSNVAVSPTSCLSSTDVWIATISREFSRTRPVVSCGFEPELSERLEDVVSEQVDDAPRTGIDERVVDIKGKADPRGKVPFDAEERVVVQQVLRELTLTPCEDDVDEDEDESYGESYTEDYTVADSMTTADRDDSTTAMRNRSMLSAATSNASDCTSRAAAGSFVSVQDEKQVGSQVKDDGLSFTSSVRSSFSIVGDYSENDIEGVYHSIGDVTSTSLQTEPSLDRNPTFDTGTSTKREEYSVFGSANTEDVPTGGCGLLDSLGGCIMSRGGKGRGLFIDDEAEDKRYVMYDTGKPVTRAVTDASQSGASQSGASQSGASHSCEESSRMSESANTVGSGSAAMSIPPMLSMPTTQDDEASDVLDTMLCGF